MEIGFDYLFRNMLHLVIYASRRFQIKKKRKDMLITHSVFLSLIFLFAAASSGFSQDSTIEISFKDLPEFVTENSPVVRVINDDYSNEIADRDIDLQFTNPVISYSQEYVENESEEEREQYLILEKQFEMPWVYSLRRKSWNHQVESADYKRDQSIRNFIADIKADYVDIGLRENKIVRLRELQRIISDVSEIAQGQREEGAISGVEGNLIRLALSNLESRILQASLEKRDISSKWKTKIGADTVDKVHLSTKIDYKPVNIESVDAYLSMIQDTSGFRQRERKIDAAQKRVSMQKTSIIPNFSLFGGYKTITPDYNGYVFGLSLPIPILNINTPQIKKEYIELNLAENELYSYKLGAGHEIQTKLATISEYNESLAELSPQFSSTQSLIDDTVFSYKEGQISITDLLNAIQIYAESIDQYYEQLAIYYRNIFELEAIINKEIASL